VLRVDELLVSAPRDICFEVGADVERWPEILPHYRWVRFREKQGFATGIVEMAAWRSFGVVDYPTWWISKMWHEPDVPVVHYKHIAGITRRMEVRWEFEARGEETLIRVVHEWQGPRWPLIGGWVANRIIGPGFISSIAQRTIAGVAAEAQRLTRHG
jgi:ribosome-associated toxin RatA of RatAB toxin-antitoxin module